MACSSVDQTVFSRPMSLITALVPRPLSRPETTKIIASWSAWTRMLYHRHGNFEMDFNDGELRYKCYMNCNGAIPTKNMVGGSIHCPAAMFKRYSKGILQILFAGMSAVDAIELCEGTLAAPASDSRDEEETSSRLMDILRRLQSGHGSSEDEMPAASGE